LQDKPRRHPKIAVLPSSFMGIEKTGVISHPGKVRFAVAAFHNNMRAKRTARRPMPGGFLPEGETWNE
jgi:hypothetical protein